MEILWLPRDVFWASVDADTRSATPDDVIDFSMPLAALKASIPIAAVQPPPDEEDFPGPVSRWYGRVGDCRFFLTYHHGSPIKDYVEVQFRSDRATRERMESAFANFRTSGRVDAGLER